MIVMILVGMKYKRYIGIVNFNLFFNGLWIWMRLLLFEGGYF